MEEVARSLNFQPGTILSFAHLQTSVSRPLCREQGHRLFRTSFRYPRWACGEEQRKDPAPLAKRALLDDGIKDLLLSVDLRCLRRGEDSFPLGNRFPLPNVLRGEDGRQ